MCLRMDGAQRPGRNGERQKPLWAQRDNKALPDKTVGNCVGTPSFGDFAELSVVFSFC